MSNLLAQLPETVPLPNHTAGYEATIAGIIEKHRPGSEHPQGSYDEQAAQVRRNVEAKVADARTKTTEQATGQLIMSGAEPNHPTEEVFSRRAA